MTAADNLPHLAPAAGRIPTGACIPAAGWRPATLAGLAPPLVWAVLFPEAADTARRATSAEWVDAAPALARGGLAARALSSAERLGLDIPDAVRRALSAQARVDAVRTMAVEQSVPRLAGRLAGAGVPFVVLKGPGIAAHYGPGDGAREFSDLDVLVRPADRRAAIDVLGGGGLSGRTSAAGGRLEGATREGVNLVVDGDHVDVHHVVPPWIWGRRLGFDDVWAAATPTAFGPAVVPVAAPVHNLLVAALHLLSDKSKPGATFRIWRDIAVLARSVDPAEASAVARDADLDWWLRFVLHELPAATRPPALLDRLPPARPRPTERARLALLWPRSAAGHHEIRRVLRLPVPNAVLALAAEAVRVGSRRARDNPKK
jgi:hypothetical protein